MNIGHTMVAKILEVTLEAIFYILPGRYQTGYTYLLKIRYT
jgi:hypothetical protein